MPPARQLAAALLAALAAGAVPGTAQAASTPSAATAHRVAVELAAAGPRPAGSAAERRAQDRVARAFARAGLRAGTDRFRVPGRGTSRNVLGIRDTPARCLRVVMAHADTVPPSPGAQDNASGLGALVAIAAALPERPPCDVWLVATGAEERPFTRQTDHLGALALARRLRRLGRARDVRFALSLDEVGRGSRFVVRSPVRAPRAGVERALLAAARATGTRMSWAPDSGTGNSDHRELELAGMPGMKLGVADEPLRHTAADVGRRLQPGAFGRVLRPVFRLLTR
jgi:aminopeptidase YwaD